MKKTTIALLLICAAAFAQQEGSFTDTRDKKTYKTVKIGEQTWMAENLNYNAKGSKCYDNKPENCAKYGKLYNWATAKEACPSGWHLPSDSEWETLANKVGSNAGEKLKSNEWGGTDDYGFSAQPGGLEAGGKSSGAGSIGLLWSATEHDAKNALRYIMDGNHGNMEKFQNDKARLLSVRCLQGDAQNTFTGSQQKGSFIDTRDKKTYKTVKIGSQTWMAENLNYDAKGSKCYGNKPANCKKYGRLYDWSTAMNIDAKFNNEKWDGSDAKHSGICPDGWHLPSNKEWQTLVNFAGGGEAGKHLKAKSGWDKYSICDVGCEEDGNGTDKYGFSALPGGEGDGYSDGGFRGAGYQGYWWSATEYDDATSNASGSFSAHGWSMDSSVDDVLGCGGKSDWHSVRCVKD
jgi:uncharacterized protein (TIGR02145 family)